MINYLSKNSLQYLINKIKEYISKDYATKDELGNINTILDDINGEVV